MAARSSTGADAASALRCVSCEYDLRGVAADAVDARCPECGHVLSGHGVERSRERRVLSSLGRRIAALATIALLATAAAIIAFPEHTLYIAPLAVLLLALGPALVAAYTDRRLP